MVAEDGRCKPEELAPAAVEGVHVGCLPRPGLCLHPAFQRLTGIALFHRESLRLGRRAAGIGWLVVGSLLNIHVDLRFGA